METPNLYFSVPVGSSADAFLDSAGSEEAHIELNLELEEAVRRAIETNSLLSLGIPGEAAYAIQARDGTASVVIQLCAMPSGLEAVLCDVVPGAPSDLPQAKSHLQRERHEPELDRRMVVRPAKSDTYRLRSRVAEGRKANRALTSSRYRKPDAGSEPNLE